MVKNYIGIRGFGNTQANFNNWGKGISDIFLAFGWKKRNDTGQVDWTTNTVYSSVYELWEMGDELNAIFPVVVKLIYYVGGFYGGYQAGSLLIQIGTATDGAGNFLGNKTSQFRLTDPYNAGDYQNNNECFASGTSSRIWMAIDNGNPTRPAGKFFAIERSKDTNGNDTAEYVTLLATSCYDTQGPLAWQQTLHRTIGAPPYEDKWIAPFPYNSLSPTGFTPIFPWLGNIQSPMLSVAASKRLVVNDLTLVPINMYGTDRLYKVFAGAGGAYSYPINSGILPIRTDDINGGQYGNTAILALWE